MIGVQRETKVSVRNTQPRRHLCGYHAQHQYECVPCGLEGLTSLLRKSVRFALKKLSSPMPQILLCESSIVSNSVLPDL